MQLSLKAALAKRKGWTAIDLARESGVHKTTVYRLIAGQTRPSHDTVQRLERALSLDPGTLTFRAGSQRAA